jgi:hypothetical protein
MMKTTLVALFMGITLLIFVPNASAQTPGCEPFGSGGTTGPAVTWFNYTANGNPDGTTNCWNPTNVFAATQLMPCGFFGEKYPGFEFNYGGEISQQFTIPTTSPHTSFTYYGFSYFLNFENPDHEHPWDLQLNIQVWDQTTGRVLISDHYDASQPDVSCSRRDPTGFYGNLAGHTILVRIMGNRGYSSSHIRVNRISLSGTQ